jgi:hypothetical protein
MKALYNTTTGQKATISKINVDNNHVIYEVFDGANSNIEASQTKAYKFSDYEIRQALYKLVNTAEECLENLAIDGFELQDDNQNWLMPDRTLRLFIPKEWLIQEVFVEPQHADLAYIINREQQLNARATEPYILNKEKYLIGYFHSIDDMPNDNLDGKTDTEVLQPYIFDAELNPQGKIIMETKTA